MCLFCNKATCFSTYLCVRRWSWFLILASVLVGLFFTSFEIVNTDSESLEHINGIWHFSVIAVIGLFVLLVDLHMTRVFSISEAEKKYNKQKEEFEQYLKDGDLPSYPGLEKYLRNNNLTEK